MNGKMQQSSIIRIGSNQQQTLTLNTLHADEHLTVYLEAHARLTFIQTYEHNCQGAFIISFILESDAQLEHELCIETTGTITGNYHFILQQKGASVVSRARILLTGSAQCTITSEQSHGASYTASELDFKTVVQNGASYSYNGTIVVAQNIQEVTAYQSDKALLMGKECSATSIPNLQILSNQVRCGHASALAHIGEEQLFLLVSRGIDSSHATQLIIQGFLK